MDIKKDKKKEELTDDEEEATTVTGQKRQEADAARRHRKRMKGTLFSKCDTPHDLFNTHRLVKTKLKQTLGRLGYLMLRDSTLMVKGNLPNFAGDDTVEVLRHIERSYKQESRFLNSDYFIPCSFLDGLISARESEKRGKPIFCLDNQLIYPSFGVYMPNSQEYLNIF